jgi:hypothetical protein
MIFTDRIAGYIRQRGAWMPDDGTVRRDDPLTPRQRRRAKHKLNRARKKGEEK